MISLQLGSPAQEAPKCPQNFPQQLDFRPHSTPPRRQPLRPPTLPTRRLKINPRDATLVLMTCVSIATLDDRLSEGGEGVRGRILRDSCDLGDTEGCREERVAGVGEAAAAKGKRKIPSEREREHAFLLPLSLSALRYRSLENINKPFAFELKSLCHLANRGFRKDIFNYV